MDEEMPLDSVKEPAAVLPSQGLLPHFFPRESSF